MLRGFWESRKGDSDIAKKALEAWYKIAKLAWWSNWSELKQTFGTADRVGNCVVFDVGSNKYRLIGRVFFGSHKLYILKVMDHAEYDRKGKGGSSSWAGECGCHRPQPPRERRTRER
jgi:mRNA interferase HigB